MIVALAESHDYRINLPVRPVTSLAKGASAAPARRLCGALDSPSTRQICQTMTETERSEP